jgi:hypothetical protein
VRWPFLLCVAALAFVRTAHAETCGPLKVTVPAKFDLTTKFDVAVPEPVDFGDSSLDAFFEQLARVARKTPGAIVRIGAYGDSNWTNDRVSGEIRRRLQAAFGDAGHGWVSFGIAWGWYHHQNLQHGTTGTWNVWNPTQNFKPDGLYGFAGSSAESNQVGATAWVETAKAGDPVGTAVSAFELSYLAQPKGGSFEVLIDGESKEIVETESAKPEMKFLRYKVKDDSHRLVVKVKKGRVRLYGVTLERDVTGVIVDGIGINGLSAITWQRFNEASLLAGLSRRGYDLVFEQTGTNMWSPQKHQPLLTKVIEQWRTALPKASYMLWSPADFMHPDTNKSEPRMLQATQEKHTIAKANKIGYWDQYGAMGGWGSAVKFHRIQWDSPDGVHFGPNLSAYIGERFVYSLLRELARRADKNAKLGCKR